jgi:NADH-quinone oxidoreductase subunit N
VAIRRDHAESTEAAMKYFVLGALASGFMLYGMSMMYGATGNLDLRNIADTVNSGQVDYLPLTFGVVFLVAGLAFKLGAVPFHMWVPDVYQGAPTAFTLVLAAAPKLAAFAITLRILVIGFVDLAADWQPMLLILAVLSLAIGNLTAIMQTNFKRMLAYSTISHMGFILLGLASGSLDGDIQADTSAYGSALFYVLTYVLTTLASFGLIMLLSRDGFECESIDDLKGLNRRSPWLAAMMLILMCSLAGLPPLVGFDAKLLILQGLLQSDRLWLAVVAVFFSLIGAFYYLRIIKVVYFDEPAANSTLAPAKPFVPRALLLVNGLLVLGLGLLPGGLIALCLQAMRATLSF